MKKVAFIMMAMFSFTAFASVKTDLIVCRTKARRLGAPTYAVSVVPAEVDTQPDLYFVEKRPLNPTADPVSVPVTPTVSLYYGGTTIFTVNNGRSGFAHFYVHKESSVIDVNLFRQLTTEGPITDYVCEVSR